MGNQRHSRSGGKQMRSSSDRMTAGAGMVGGRLADPPSPEEGGGYLDICTSPWAGMRPAPRDPRIDALVSLGISDRWIRIARVVGVDAFLAMWRILDEESDGYHGARVRVPRYESWRRQARNEYIVQLAEQGLRPRQIRRILAKERVCGSISERHICRIIASAVE